MGEVRTQQTHEPRGGGGLPLGVACLWFHSFVWGAGGVGSPALEGLLTPWEEGVWEASEAKGLEEGWGRARLGKGLGREGSARTEGAGAGSQQGQAWVRCCPSLLLAAQSPGSCFPVWKSFLGQPEASMQP